MWAGWDPHDLHALARVSWDGPVLCRSCTSSHNGRWGTILIDDLDHDLSDHDLSDLDSDLSVRGVNCIVNPSPSHVIHVAPWQPVPLRAPQVSTTSGFSYGSGLPPQLPRARRPVCRSSGCHLLFRGKTRPNSAQQGEEPVYEVFRRSCFGFFSMLVDGWFLCFERVHDNTETPKWKPVWESSPYNHIQMASPVRLSAICALAEFDMLVYGQYS